VNLDQEKRVMLAFALSIVMLVLYRVYFVKEQPPEPKQAPRATAATTTAAATAPAKAAVPSAPARVVLPILQGAKPEEIVVENNLYRVMFSTQGAVVRSWVLKMHPDTKEELLDTVDSPACESLGFPMSVDLPNSALHTQLNQGIYVVEVSEFLSGGRGGAARRPYRSVLAPPVTLTFTYSDGKIQAKKQFSFGAEYVAKVEVSVFDGQYYLPVEVTWPGGFGDHSLPPSVFDSIRLGVYGSIGDLTTTVQGKVKEDRTIPGPLQLAGLEDKYFASVFLPEAPDQISFRLARQEWSPPDWREKEKPRPLLAGLIGTQPKPLAFRLMVAPKNLDVLKSVNPPLDSLVDFGWFSLIAKPLFLGLGYIYEHWIHNYGWAIVLLTVIINMAMFPLKLKSFRSAQEMQKVQPIMKGIQDKYKNYKFNDPRKQKMNEEMMKVYKEHGINPFGGCLPMLLQIPFMYAFYRMLDVAIELRHAPWILWIKDLSAPDRLMIMGVGVPVLVILMTIATFVSTKMTPMTTTDPTQQRMMMLMPLMFFFMFLRFASGLVLYWLTSSVVQILQQVYINRRMPPPNPLPVPRKPIEARR
jgi:YidC/Oxa1 family membrane protein insertase